jgi:arabinofuranosyltransferase
MPSESTDATPRPGASALQLVSLAAFLLFCIVVVKDAWLSDDAFITLRTIDNFWNGYGLRWNPIERVQTYTHPLWMLLLGAVYGVTREPHVTTLAVSLAVTGAVAWLLFKRLTLAGRAFALVALAGSRAFVDYSTSGLENPLSHLLLAPFWLLVLEGSEAADAAPPSRRRLLTLALLASLAMLSRLDLVLLTAPGLLVELWRSRRVLRAREIAGVLALASMPLVLWQGFALLYYGFVFPNTAYAKLGTGLSSSALMAQGLRYLGESFRNDPLTLLAIAAAVFVSLWRRTMATTALAFALAAYVGSVVRAGGDFMSGRFLTPPFLCAVILLAKQLPATRRLEAPVALAVGVAAVVSLAVPASPFRFSPSFDMSKDIREAHGIVDERAVHSPWMGLLPALRGVHYTNHMWAQQRFGVPRVWTVGAIGVVGYTAGPGYHGLDPLALADPLLARLSVPPGSKWRIGHFERKLPDGYEETLQLCVQRLFPSGAIRPPTGNCVTVWDEINRFRDPALAQAYRELMLITQGPLFDRARLYAIVRWNLGRGPLDAARMRATIAAAARAAEPGA